MQEVLTGLMAQGSANQAAVVLHRVGKRFGSTQALKEISFEVGQGEFVAFIGPSGCGKTTLLRMIAGLERPTDGAIYIGGRKMNDIKPWQRDTPMVWQNFALFPYLSVRQNVEYGLRTRGADSGARQRRVARALEMVGISELADRRIAQLSGGQKQRVGIARALVTEPQVLLLDEPLGSLDAHLRIRMQSELRGLQRNLGLTFVYVTHNQSEALAMADRVVVMDRGHVCQVGSPREVYRQPANRFVAEFVGTNNIFSGKVARVESRGVAVSTRAGLFTVGVPDGDIRRIGDPVTFVICSDRIVTGFEGESRANRVVGALKGQEFVGSVVTLFLELKDGTEFRIQKQEHQMIRISTKLGEDLAASWSSEDAYLLPSD